MIRFRLLMLGFWLSGLGMSCLQAQVRIPLAEALSQEKVQVSLRSLGGYQGRCVRLAVKNLTDEVVSLELMAGQVFRNTDPEHQTLMLTQDTYLALAPKAVVAEPVYTMCIQAPKMSPRRGMKFELAAQVDGPLLKLAQRINKGKYQNSTAQSAVWAIADGERIYDVYGEDTAMVRDVAEVVSEARDIPIDSFDLQPRRHQLTRLDVSLEGVLKQPLLQARLGLYDQEGQLVRAYFAGKSYPKGFRQWKVGASHTLGDSTALYLRLHEGEQLLMERVVTAADSVTPLQRVHSEAVLRFELHMPTQAEVGVYDENGILYMPLESRSFEKGFHRHRYIAGSPLPPHRRYFIQAWAGDQRLASQELDLNAPPPVQHELRQVRGTFTYRLESPLQGGQIALYDADGQLTRILSKIRYLNPGMRYFRYQFSHRDGPGARFWIRLEDGEGRVLGEKEVR